MQKRDSLSFRANPRLLIYELNAGAAAALQHRVEIVNRKADVMNAGSPLGEEAGNRRGGVFRLEKLYQRLAGAKAGDAGSVRIVQDNLRQTQYIPKKRNAICEGFDGDANVGYTGATRT